MDRVAVFVDAGYVLAARSVLLKGHKVDRPFIDLNHVKILELLREFALQAAQVPLLRIYWYDGAANGPTPQHRRLARSQDVKVRLGIVN